MNGIPYLAAKLGSPRLLKYFAGKAGESAGVLESRQGPCADLAWCHASRTLYRTPAQLPVPRPSALLTDVAA